MHGGQDSRRPAPPPSSPPRRPLGIGVRHLDGGSSWSWRIARCCRTRHGPVGRRRARLAVADRRTGCRPPLLDPTRKDPALTRTSPATALAGRPGRNRSSSRRSCPNPPASCHRTEPPTSAWTWRTTAPGRCTARAAATRIPATNRHTLAMGVSTMAPDPDDSACSHSPLRRLPCHWAGSPPPPAPPSRPSAACPPASGRSRRRRSPPPSALATSAARSGPRTGSPPPTARTSPTPSSSPSRSSRPVTAPAAVS